MTGSIFPAIAFGVGSMCIGAILVFAFLMAAIRRPGRMGQEGDGCFLMIMMFLFSIMAGWAFFLALASPL